LRRRRFGRAVRLEVDREMPAVVRELLMAELELGTDDVYESSAPLGLSQLWAIHGLDRPDLHEPPWVPMTPPRLATAGDGPVDLFSVLRERDVLVHHPYDSFTTSVEAFITQAADDPNVLAIKQTLYRTSDDTAIVSALVRAAEQGKQVAALVEVKARFDEQANILWARQLERAGVHVVYGLVGLKTHSKIALVVRREEDGLRRYCHIGTGNYNSETAKIYEDLGLLTSDPAIGEDLTDLFNHLTGYGRPITYRRVVVAPQGMRPWVLGQIAEEAAAGEAGRITIKANGLTDPEVVDALYAASQAGVRVDLVIRGVCSLRPGVPGLSDRITVRSIMGRFLEHSRIYRFGDPAGERQVRYTIGSGDLMERNLDRRIEVLVPVLDPELRARLEETIELNLADDTMSWELGPDGDWVRVVPVLGLSAQRRLQELALERARRRRSPESLN
jgi:polyphosphate kinase